MRILIVKTSALGDIIHSFLAVNFLKKKFPQASIDWVVEKPFFDLLSSHPLIDKTWVIDTKKWRSSYFSRKNLKEMAIFIKNFRKKKYDYVFDLQGNCKSGLVLFFTRAKEKIGFDRRGVSEWPNIFFTSKRFSVDDTQPIALQYLHLVLACFSSRQLNLDPSINFFLNHQKIEEVRSLVKKGKKPHFMVCMGSNWNNKKLSYQTWQEFLAIILNKFTPTLFFVWKSQEEKKEAKALSKYFSKSSYLLPSLSLPLWQQLMQEMHLVLSVDSAALHLAATTSVKTYSFFGPSSLHIYKPIGSQHGAFQATCPYLISFEKRCPKLRSCPTGACLKNIQGKDLAQAFVSWYESLI